MARCPGQDQRFWKPEDIFEVKCPVCETSVEFWKDEPQVKCPGCKHEIVNPKLDLGCAQWCQYAEECLGMVNKQEHTVLSNKLIECLRQIAGSDRNVIRDSLEILRYAERILVNEGGDPLVIKAAAIFSQVFKPHRRENENSGAHIDVNGGVNIRDILTTYGVPNEIIDSICRILNACHSDKRMDSIEFNILWDARRLAQLQQPTGIGNKTGGEISWKTETGKKLAKELSHT